MTKYTNVQDAISYLEARFHDIDFCNFDNVILDSCGAQVARLICKTVDGEEARLTDENIGKIGVRYTQSGNMYHPSDENTEILFES